MAGTKADFSTVRFRITDLFRNKRSQFPTLPVVLQNIIQVSRDPDTSARELATFIEKDQAIAYKVLRLANSSYYGMGRKIDTVLRAITIIGFEEIIGLAVGIGILPSLKADRIGKIIDMRQLWLHSLACCFAARIIDNVIEKNRTERTSIDIGGKNNFLPILLHDMGKALFSLYFPHEYATVVDNALQNELPLSGVEQEVLGFDHAEFAARLMEYWKIPASIVAPVRYHHVSEKYLGQEIEVRLLYIANALARKVHIGNSYNPHPYRPEKIAADIGLESDDLDKCAQALDEQRHEVEQFLELIS